MNMRTCIVTKTSGTRDEMLRFVADPDARLVPDLKEKLPGRGAWVLAQRPLLEKALKQRAFSKSLKTELYVTEDLPELTEGLLRKAVLGSLALARKGGGVIAGATKILGALNKENIALVLHAQEAAEDGKRKISQALYRHTQATGEKIPVQTLLTAEELGYAFATDNIMHVAILKKKATDGLLTWIKKLQMYRGQTLSQNAKALEGADNND